MGHIFLKKKKFLKINSSYPDKTGRKKLIQNFLDILNKKNTKPILSLREQLNLMSICLSAERSIKLNKKIKINYF